jgi:hypothetical protein
VRLITIAVADDGEAERRIAERFGKIDVLFRAPVDARTLGLLRLQLGEWVEWVSVEPVMGRWWPREAGETRKLDPSGR